MYPKRDLLKRGTTFTGKIINSVLSLFRLKCQRKFLAEVKLRENDVTAFASISLSFNGCNAVKLILFH